MKRKPSHEQFNQQLPFKQTAKKSRSPATLRRPKPKFQNEVLSFLGQPKSKITKQKQECLKGQLKGDSHNSTANCTFSRSRIPKGKKGRQRSQVVKRQEQMSEGEIMDLINTFAIKIQRQWRVYLLRKHFKQFIKSEIQKRRKSQTKRSSLEVSAFDKLKFDENRIRHLSYLTDNGEEIVSSYNLQKYEQYESSLANSKEMANNDPISYRSHSNSDKQSIRLDNDTAEHATKRIAQLQPKSSFQQSNLSRLKSKQAIQSERGDNSYRLREQPMLEREERRISYDSCQLPKRSNIENRRHSTGDLLSTKELKQFQIDKAFEIKIVQQSAPTKPLPEITKKAGEGSPAKRGEDEREGFNIKYPFDKALKYKRKEIEDYKQRKLLSIESRFQRKEMTERSYLQICRKINEQHDNRLEYFREREGEIRSNWSKLLAISKQNRPNNGRYAEDDQEHLHNSISNIDASLSFDRWDFNSSAKKSLDGNLLEDAHNSKNYSLESVLRYLEEEDTEKEVDDRDKDREKERKFRKKSRQVIEAIAERSKEISDKSVQEFVEVPSTKQTKDQKGKYDILEAIEIEQPSCDKKAQSRQQAIILKVEDNSKVELPVDNQQQLKNVSIDLQNQTEKPAQSGSKKKIQPKSQSQSLLISQIEAASPSQNIYSDREFCQSGEKTILKQLLFKDFQSGEKGEDKVLKKFIELVNEKYVLSNIKLINSLKFMFAKMGDERKQQQLKAKAAIKFQPIESDINAINTWLLQISHFILDNYQSVVRENLVNVKQPPPIELLAHAHKEIPYSNPYETVPEYVFKDFEFYYIKTLARNYGIGADKYDAFSTLLYTFHRSLIDSLNLALMEELISGKRWLEVPWANEFRQKKKVKDEHAKSCLERSINVVSNWGEYGQGRLQYENDLAQLQNKPYEDEKINMVCREEALDLPLVSTFTEAHILLAISKMIFEEEVDNAYRDIFS